MERLLQEGFIPQHRHIKARVNVREVRLRNRAPRKTFVLESIEVIDAPLEWPVRTTQQAF